MVTNCCKCIEHRKPSSEPMILSVVPERPWQVLRTDLFSLNGRTYLLVMDYYSRFIEISILLASQKSSKTRIKVHISQTRNTNILRSDNAPKFVSTEFDEFSKEYSFTHVTSSQELSQANGEAERAVQTIKNALKKEKDPGKALMSYRATPLENGCSLSEMHFGRTIGTTIPVFPDKLKPSWPGLQELREHEQESKIVQTKRYNVTDDTQIFSSSYDANELVVKLNSDLARVRNWLIENKLQMHPSKSKLMFIGSSYNLKIKNTEQPVVVNNTPVSRTDTHKCLGVQIDEKLSWDSHIDMICRKTSAGIGAMRRIKPFAPVDTLEKVYKSLVQLYFEYCSPLWDNCGKLLKDKLQRFQSRAARVLTGANYDIRSADIIQTLSWDTLDARRLRAKSTLMYKILNDDTAPNLRNSFVRRNVDQTDYHLRNSATDLTLPKPKREFLKRSFKYSGAMLWNQLPNEAKLAESIYSFNEYIKT
ncbi:uncharacterized protein LOC122962870 [Acropora millepora]|uniref:uncharacterized protein LOC122962870 n=1 Tax=Acropora millepora TaxID=45264 RepID=UPI001CF5EB04|nr:uncharacterized protein LOC122962870 [Acropora millepora]